MPRTDLRASDLERETAIAELQSHAAVGRLAAEELEERVEAALGALTRRDLAGLVEDLPPVAPAIAAEVARPDADGQKRRRDGGWAAYASVMALLVGIWLITGGGYLWPLYPALGWGIPLLVARWSSPTHRARRRFHAVCQAPRLRATKAR